MPVPGETVVNDQAAEANSLRASDVTAMVPLLGYQKRLLENDARFTWACWARQTGKSFTFSLRRVLRGIVRRRAQLFLSASMRQSKELMLKVQQHCQALQIAIGWEENKAGGKGRSATKEIRLPNGVRLIALPARAETVRGFTGDVFLDEFAMHADDKAIWAAIFPTILRGEGELDVASTPKGKDNLFSELRENDAFERSIVTLPEAVEQGLQIDIKALRQAMGDDELFRQEFLCEFLDESEAFLAHRLIAACEDASLDKEPDWDALEEGEADIFAGVDVGRKRDLTVIWLWEAQPAWRGSDGGAPEGRLRCAGVIELRGTPFSEQKQVLRRVLKCRGVKRCCIDATGMGWPLAEWAQEQYGRSRIEALQFTTGLKAQMAGRLRVLAEEGKLRIPADEAIRNDFHSVRRGTTATGGLRLQADRTGSGHADRFWAAALGLHAAQNGGGGPIEYTSTGHLRFARTGIW